MRRFNAPRCAHPGTWCISGIVYCTACGEALPAEEVQSEADLLRAELNSACRALERLLVTLDRVRAERDEAFKSVDALLAELRGRAS